MSDIATSAQTLREVTLEDLKKLPRNWTSTSFLYGIHLMGALGVWLYATHRLELPRETVWLAWFMFFASGFSITGGYHRLISHCSYETRPLFLSLFLFFGAAAMLGPAIGWTAKHRYHHKHPNTELDAYPFIEGAGLIGLYFAHWELPCRIGKVEGNTKNVADLKKKWVFRAQEKYYLPLAFCSAILLPCGIAYWGWGDAWAVFPIFFIRLPPFLHLVFSTNSFAHWNGPARNLPVLNWLVMLVMLTGLVLIFVYGMGFVGVQLILAGVAVIAFGENHDHGEHHTYPSQYRCRPLTIDPTGLIIWLMSFVGLTWNLKGKPRKN